jgi:hypothetical protein
MNPAVHCKIRDQDIYKGAFPPEICYGVILRGCESLAMKRDRFH